MEMNTKIKRALAKKKLTGAEAGRLFVACMISEAKGAEPLFSKGEYAALLEKIPPEEEERDALQTYTMLCSVLATERLKCREAVFRFYSGFNKLRAVAEAARDCERALAGAEQQPLIMTAAQYSRMKEKAEAQLRERKEAFWGVLCSVLASFIEAPEEAPEEVRTELEKAGKMIVGNTDKEYAISYNMITGRGYWMLSDGRRSDEMSREAWEQALLEAVAAKRGASTIEDYNRSQLEVRYKLFFNGAEGLRRRPDAKAIEALSDEYVERALEDNVRRAREALASGIPFYLAERKFYEELPDGLTMLDLLKVFAALYDTAKNGDEKVRKGFAANAASAGRVFPALQEYVAKKLQAFGEFSGDRFSEEAFTWGQLAEAGVIGYGKRVHATDCDIIEAATGEAGSRRRIAILTDKEEAGDYEQADYLEAAFGRKSLELLDDEIIDENIKCEDLIYSATAYFYTYNALLEIFSTLYKIPEVMELARDTKELEAEISNYNKLIYELYYNVQGSAERKAYKRELIKAAFVPLEPEETAPSGKELRQIKRNFKEAGFTEKAQALLSKINQIL